MFDRPYPPFPGLVLGILLLMHGGAVTAQQAMPAHSNAAGHTSTDPVSVDEARQWRADLAFLAENLVARHKSPFHRVSRAQFDAGVRRLDTQIPRLARHQIVAGVQRIVASLRDGHTTMVLGGPGVGFHYLPVELYLYQDGLFVRAAPAERADLVGARIVRIGDTDVEAAIDSVALYVSHENESWVRQNAPALLRMPEVLHAAGITEAPDRTSFVVEQDGGMRTVQLLPAGVFVVAQHGRPIVDTGSWTTLARSTAADHPLRARRPGELFWEEYLPDDRMLYVAYRAVADRSGHETNAAFFRRVFALADSLQPQRFVLDLRDNHGGNSFHNREVIRQVLQRPWLDRPDRLFVLIGRGTFSAAQNLVNDLEYYSNATFVGEATGNAPNMFGDHEMIQLPNSGVLVAVSTRWHQGPRGDTDRRLFTAPRLFVDPTAADHAAGRDPALDVIVAHGGAPQLRDQLAHSLAAGDTALAARQFDAYRNAPINRYANVEAEANTAGYVLLGDGRVEDAIFVFRLNAVAYAASANPHDSLGEAYERAGRPAQAAASYRRALAIDPGYASSLAGLERLGVAHSD